MNRPRSFRLCFLALVARMSLVGCVDTSPSTGRCTGTLDGRAIDLPIDPAPSGFYRDDDILGDEDGPFTISYGSGAIRVEGEFANLPSSRDLGTYRVPAPDRVGVWALSTTLTNDVAGVTTLTLTTASRERVVGSFAAEIAGGTLMCTLNLRRAYERDTDD